MVWEENWVAEVPGPKNIYMQSGAEVSRLNVEDPCAVYVVQRGNNTAKYQCFGHLRHRHVRL